MIEAKGMKKSTTIICFNCGHKWDTVKRYQAYCRKCGIINDVPRNTARPRCHVCGTTDHHVDADGNIVQNPPRVA